MSSKVSRSRDPRSPNRYEYDADRGRGRHPRSVSRERKPSPPPQARKHARDVDIDRERDRSHERRKKDDMPPPSAGLSRRRSRGRSRSMDSRRSGRHEDRSKRRRHSPSPRHRSHKKRHASISPDRRRRSRSAGHSRHKRARRPRSRSRTPVGMKSNARDASRSPLPRSPRKHKSSHRERSRSRSPKRHAGSPPPLARARSPMPRRAVSPISRRAASPTPRRAASPTPRRAASPTPRRAISPTPRRAASPTPRRAASPTSRRPLSPAPPIRSRAYSPERGSRRPISPSHAKSRYISPPTRKRSPPRRDEPIAKKIELEYTPRRRSRSRSPLRYSDRGSTKRARSPPPVNSYTPAARARSPRGPTRPQRLVELFPDRRSPPSTVSRSARQPPAERPLERTIERRERPRRDDEVDIRPRKVSAESSPSRRRTPLRSPKREQDQPSNRRSAEYRSPAPSNKGESQAGQAPDHHTNSERQRKIVNEDRQSRPERIEHLERVERPTERPERVERVERQERSGRQERPDRSDVVDRGRGRGGRGRGRGRGLDHHRNQPLTFGGEFPARGRGSSRGRGAPSAPGQSAVESISPPRPDPSTEQPHISPDRQSIDRNYPRGPARGTFSGRGRGRGGRIEGHGHQITAEMEMDTVHETSVDRPIPTGPAADGKNAPPTVPSQLAGPFRKVQEVENAPKAPVAESPISFRPFTMAIPPKAPKAAKPVPKALDALKPAKFATGSNSAPLGGTIDLSSRLARGRHDDGRSNRDERDPRDVRDTRDVRDVRDVRDPHARDPRDVRDHRDPRDYRDPRDTRDRRAPRDARDMKPKPRDYRERPRSPIRSPTVRRPRSPVALQPPPPPPPLEVVVKDMPIYHRVSMVGEGTYGKVYKASNNLTKELVALKRIRMENEKDGFPITAVREMRLLQALKHDNIISLLEMMVEKSDFYMVFNYMDHDLTGILNHPTFRLTLPNIKDLAYQFFDALHYLHHRGVLHRDIKGSNILLNNDGQLKITDFGLARFYTKNSKKELDYTNRIITLWYRPPEILLGATAYGPAVDMWSAACVFIELFTRQPAFPGRTEIDQLDIIYDILGKPTEKVWPTLKQMPWYSLLKTTGHNRKNRFKAKYEKLIPPSALDLITKLLQYDPEKRPAADECLRHPYFFEEPAAEPTIALRDLKGDWHEYESKMERRKERDQQRKRHDAEKKKNREAKETERQLRRQQQKDAAYDPAREIVGDAKFRAEEAEDTIAAVELMDVDRAAASPAADAMEVDIAL